MTIQNKKKTTTCIKLKYIDMQYIVQLYKLPLKQINLKYHKTLKQYNPLHLSINTGYYLPIITTFT